MKKGPYHGGIADENGRTCTICLAYKPWSEFGRMRTGINGHCPRCKECDNLTRAGADLGPPPKHRETAS